MAFVAAALGVAGAGFLINDLVGMYQDRQTGRMEDAAAVQDRVYQSQMLRRIGQETRQLRNQNALMDLGLTLQQLQATRPRITEYQEATAMTNDFLATLTDTNRFRLAALSTPTVPGSKELLLEQAINKRFQ